MTPPLHIGFTGTRHGMTPAQFHAVRRVLAEITVNRVFVAHHGDCVGADAEFHDICGTFCGRAIVEIHPGPLSDLSAGCRGTVRHKPMSHMKRNAAIVAAASVMIAAPFENEPQDRGGTWATIGMALRALRAGKLGELHVVGRDGRLLDRGAWSW